METDKRIKAIVAEDNRPNRELIESYLSHFPQIQIVSSVSSGQEVLERIEKETENITALFLDIEMPGLNGLATAARIREIYPNIFIIFITGHVEYAAEAFQLEATDYLIKPISKEAIERAINRIDKHLDHQQWAKGLDDILVIKNQSETYFIRSDSIIFIEKEVRKTIIHTENTSYLTLEPLHVLEKKLNSNFFRCHKGFIVNIKKIEKIMPIADRIYQIFFYNYPLKATMGRKKLEDLYKIMTQIVVEG